MAVDAANAPHAIWSAGSSMLYSRKQAGGWIAPIQLSQADATYNGHAVAVVPGTTKPCVLYTRTPFGAPAGELVLADWNGTGFSTRSLTADGVTKVGPAFALDAGGAYHVVCVVQVLGEWCLRYLTDVTDPPTDVLLAVGPLGQFGSGASPSIAVEPGGVAHVVYRGASGPYRIHNAENATPGDTTWSWQALVSPNVEDTGADVKVDASGAVHVVASGTDCDLCTRHTHVFQRPAGGAWGAPSPIVHALGLTQASLALDPGGAAHVALSEIGGNIFTGRVLFASSRTGWSPSLVIGSDHSTPSLAIDAQGRGHLVCTTGSNTGLRNVLYLQSPLTTVDVSGPPPVADSRRAAPNPFSRQTVMRITGAGHSASDPIVILDVAGRSVRRLPPTSAMSGGFEYVWDGRNEAGTAVPAGVYRVVPARGSREAAPQARTMTVVKLN